MNPQARHLAMSLEAVQPAIASASSNSQSIGARPCTISLPQMIEHSAGRSTDPEPTSYSRGVRADAQQRYDDVIGDFPV